MQSSGLSDTLLIECSDLEPVWRLWLTPLYPSATEPTSLIANIVNERSIRIDIPPPASTTVYWSDGCKDRNCFGLIERIDSEALIQLIVHTIDPERLIQHLRLVLAQDRIRTHAKFVRIRLLTLLQWSLPKAKRTAADPVRRRGRGKQFDHDITSPALAQAVIQLLTEVVQSESESYRTELIVAVRSPPQQATPASPPVSPPQSPEPLSPNRRGDIKVSSPPAATRGVGDSKSPASPTIVAVAAPSAQRTTLVKSPSNPAGFGSGSGTLPSPLSPITLPAGADGDYFSMKKPPVRIRSVSLTGADSTSTADALSILLRCRVVALYVPTSALISASLPYLSRSELFYAVAQLRAAVGEAALDVDESEMARRELRENGPNSDHPSMLAARRVVFLMHVWMNVLSHIQHRGFEIGATSTDTILTVLRKYPLIKAVQLSHIELLRREKLQAIATDAAADDALTMADAFTDASKVTDVKVGSGGESVGPVVLKRRADPFDVLLTRSMGGDRSAQCAVALIFRDGSPQVSVNSREALRWLLISAAQGSARAEYFLGEMYEHGDGMPRPDIPSAVRHYRLAAAKGVERGFAALHRLRVEAEAGPDLRVLTANSVRAAPAVPVAYVMSESERAMLYTRGDLDLVNFGDQDIDMQREDILATLYQGRRYRDGIDVRQDIAKGMTLIRKAMDIHRRPESRTKLGVWYDYVLGECEYRLGESFEFGLGETRNLIRALQYYRVAAAKGVVLAKKAIRRLGFREPEIPFYARQLAIDDQSGFSARLAEAKAGNPEAALSIAVYFRNAIAKVDSIEAYDMVESQSFKHAMSAAVCGLTAAQSLVAYYYAIGAGTARDEAAAGRWYEAAAAMGDVNANFNIAMFYERGAAGYRADPEMAREFYKAAARYGDAEARAAFSRVAGRFVSDADRCISDSITFTWPKGGVVEPADTKAAAATQTGTAAAPAPVATAKAVPLAATAAPSAVAAPAGTKPGAATLVAPQPLVVSAPIKAAPAVSTAPTASAVASALSKQPDPNCEEFTIKIYPFYSADPVGLQEVVADEAAAARAAAAAATLARVNRSPSTTNTTGSGGVVKSGGARPMAVHGFASLSASHSLNVLIPLTATYTTDKFIRDMLMIYRRGDRELDSGFLKLAVHRNSKTIFYADINQSDLQLLQNCLGPGKDVITVLELILGIPNSNGSGGLREWIDIELIDYLTAASELGGGVPETFARADLLAAPVAAHATRARTTSTVAAASAVAPLLLSGLALRLLLRIFMISDTVEIRRDVAKHLLSETHLAAVVADRYRDGFSFCDFVISMHQFDLAQPKFALGQPAARLLQRCFAGARNSGQYASLYAEHLTSIAAALGGESFGPMMQELVRPHKPIIVRLMSSAVPEISVAAGSLSAILLNFTKADQAMLQASLGTQNQRNAARDRERAGADASADAGVAFFLPEAKGRMSGQSADLTNSDVQRVITILDTYDKDAGDVLKDDNKTSHYEVPVTTISHIVLTKTAEENIQKVIAAYRTGVPLIIVRHTSYVIFHAFLSV